MIHIRGIFRIIGNLLFIEALLMLVCTGVSYYYHDGATLSFLSTAGITAAVSIITILLCQKGERQINRRDGYVLVSLSWVSFTCFGMLPFYPWGYIPDFTDAFFETMSGFTSTGATILENIEQLPKSLLFWRSLTQWMGGLGIIMFTVAFLPFFGVNGLQVFAAETTGPTHSRVTPRIGMTAKWIWSIYMGLTIVLFALLMLGGMNGFDSVCHALTTASTGGFSTKQNSIEYFQSPFIHYVIILFMFISGINFNLLYLFVHRKFRKALSDTELKWYTGCVITVSIIIAGILYLHRTYDGVESTIRHALFQVVSLQTSTGFAITDYALWAPVTVNLLLILMVVGSCAGSTSGGMKCIRVSILTKVTWRELKHIIHPNAVLPIRINKQVIPATLISTVFAFSFIYVFIIIASALLFSAMGVGFSDSLGCAISALGNIGPAIDSFGPTHTFSALPVAGKWLMSLLMLMGRLEIFTILLLFYPIFWKKY